MGAKQDRERQALHLWWRGAELYPMVAQWAEGMGLVPKRLRWLERQLKADPERAWFKLVGWLHEWQMVLRECQVARVERALLRIKEEIDADELKRNL